MTMRRQEPIDLCEEIWKWTEESLSHSDDVLGAGWDEGSDIFAIIQQPQIESFFHLPELHCETRSVVRPETIFEVKKVRGSGD
jgi:hypothetical protein